MLAIDHVVLPVTDLALAAAELEARYGLASIEGGRHPAWGTANRIVPLGDCYLELVAVIDAATAAHTSFGTWVAKATPGEPLGWAVRTDAIEAVGRRLGGRSLAGRGLRPPSSSRGASPVSMSQRASRRCRSSSSGAMAWRCQVRHRCSIPAGRRG